MPDHLTTKRLLLIPATADMVRADLLGRIELERHLDADVPENWPPELLVDALPTFLEQLENDPCQVGWWMWYWLLKPDRQGRPVLIGSGGFCGLAPGADTVETGYSVLDQFQRQGYATEAVAATTAWAFSHSEIKCVVAHTYPHLVPSIRVLEKNGYRQVGPGTEPDTIRFERRRNGFVTPALSSATGPTPR
jgi:RimJ/RimL family protein N-acetyltransferase